MSLRLSRSLLVVLMSLIAATASAQATTGLIEGRVLDVLTGSPLPGALVVLEGTTFSAHR